jgi:hypothetical protein
MLIGTKRVLAHRFVRRIYLVNSQTRCDRLHMPVEMFCLDMREGDWHCERVTSRFPALLHRLSQCGTSSKKGMYTGQYTCNAWLTYLPAFLSPTKSDAKDLVIIL